MDNLGSQTEISESDQMFGRLDALSAEASSALDQAQRAARGQFLTSSTIAHFMARMFTERPRVLSILDAGAGIGMLSFCLAVEACAWEDKPDAIEITAFEIDPILRGYLERVYAECKSICEKTGVRFHSHIVTEDFARVAADELAGSMFATDTVTYNAAILNPPYCKLNNNSPTSTLLRQAGIEATNLYAAFVWLAARLLEDDGELVAITPRSFCNGLYFRRFRVALLSMLSIRGLHVYGARDRAFGGDDVLQENIILHAAKEQQQPDVTVTSSHDPTDALIAVRQVPFERIIYPEDPEKYFHIAVNGYDQEIASQARSLTSALSDLKLSVSTGKVVDFRAAPFLRNQPEANTVPLIYPLHLATGEVKWPDGRGKKPEHLVVDRAVAGTVVSSGWYVLVKRFTSKEERRRIVASVLDPSKIPYARIAFENHVNYYHQNGSGLDRKVAVGLASFLNSTMMDEYYRQFSGHTQINATDLRNIRYPSLDQLIAIGNALGDAPPDQDALDKVVTEKLDMARQNQPMTTKKMVDEALDVLRELGVPRAQLNSRSALTLLSLLDLKPGDKWSSALGPLRGITEMMDYFRDQFGVTYAPNTRETVRRFTVHQFVQMGLLVANPDDPMRPINSPHTRYQIEPTLLKLVKAYRSKTWERNLEVYRQQASSIRVLHEADRQMHQVAVTLPDGGAVKLSAGGQNTLIKQIVEEFCSRYTPGGQVLYLGDAGKKHKVHERERLAELGVVLDEHAKMPDVIVHFSKRNWLVLIEAVTSHGPIDLKRHNELKALFATSKAPLAFVTAFENRRTLVKYMQAIAWETDVWVAESPTHLIHFNGERYLGPYEYQRNRGATTSSVLANKPARSSDARRKRRD